MVEAHFHVSILKTSHEHMEMIRTANVVLGVDAESGDPSGVFFYGLDQLEFIADAGLTSSEREHLNLRPPAPHAHERLGACG